MNTAPPFSQESREPTLILTREFLQVVVAHLIDRDEHDELRRAVHVSSSIAHVDFGVNGSSARAAVAMTTAILFVTPAARASKCPLQANPHSQFSVACPSHDAFVPRSCRTPSGSASPCDALTPLNYNVVRGSRIARGVLAEVAVANTYETVGMAGEAGLIGDGGQRSVGALGCNEIEGDPQARLVAIIVHRAPHVCAKHSTQMKR